jgi:ABC-2 type transport system permease protein
MLVDPMLYLVLFAVGMTAAARPIHFRGVEMSYMEFFIPGLLSIQGLRFFSRAIFDSSNDLKWGMYRLAVLMGCRPADYVVSRLVSGTLVYSLQAGLLLATGTFFVEKPLVALARAPGMLAIGCLGLILWLCLGMILGVRVRSYARRDLLSSVVILPAMFGSSAFFTIEGAPLYLRALATINPLTYHADALRLAFIAEQVWLSFELGLLALLAGATSLFSVWMLSRAVLVSGER